MPRNRVNGVLVSAGLATVATGVVVGGCLYAANRLYFAGARCLSQTRLEDHIVIVTGANTGIGLETAGELARRGALVVMAGRSMPRLEAARAQLLARHSAEAAHYHNAGKQDESNLTHITPKQLILEQLNLASLTSIREFAKRFLIKFQKLHILVNNAGVMGCPYTETADGFELHIGTNYIGHFHLTNLLLPALKAAALAKEEARIVNVSSVYHRKALLTLPEINLRGADYNPYTAYNQSKLANVVFTIELAKRLHGSNIHCVALHPGITKTELTRYYSSVARFFFFQIGRFFVKTPWEGAQTTLHCALTTDLVSGAYYSDCQAVEPLALAKDPEIGRQLWETTERLIHEAEAKQQHKQPNQSIAQQAVQKARLPQITQSQQGPQAPQSVQSF